MCLSGRERKGWGGLGQRACDSMRIVYDLLEKRQTQESQGNNQRERKTETTFS